MYPFKPAICLTPVILTGAQDVPKLLLGFVNSTWNNGVVRLLANWLNNSNPYRSSCCMSSTKNHPSQ
ncbi:hypothetical protein WISP_15146 [Willisornis vidua]|uniref:Uncharacterized protein n=1 Tax=Willisornis vidua TaxID=1566151 RepID=A0ABQ9DUL2_9PASS|nr:hypothetical protein WISP_15146 [Willisornis vidua]